MDVDEKILRKICNQVGYIDGIAAYMKSEDSILRLQDMANAIREATDVMFEYLMGED